MRKIQDYYKFINKSAKKEIIRLAQSLKDEHIVMINSTPAGGGVSEILNSLVLLMNDLDLQVGWRILKGSDNFFQISKGFHNSLQGEKLKLSNREKELYESTNYINARTMHINDHDLVVIHDPQPLPLIKYYKKRSPWIWRVHIDMSQPDKSLLKYFKQFIEQYDAMIISSPNYHQSSLKVKQIVIHPSIDPLSDKNVPLDKKSQVQILKSHGLKLDKPIVSQISRFDKWKDPLGVIKVFEKIRRNFDCRLVLMGNISVDDPEGSKILAEVQEASRNNPDIRVLINAKDNDRTVNALQSFSKVVIQKSLKEGFALTVSEAMWKYTPVVGTRIGGIPLQIVNGQTGYLVDNYDQVAKACLKILRDKKLQASLGKAAHQRVKNNFLITRHLLDYLRLFDYFLNKNHGFNIDSSYPYGQIK